MNQVLSPLSLRTAATPSGTMNTLLRAGLGGALLALTAACSGDLDVESDGFDGELEDQGSEVVDAFESADAPEAVDTVEKGQFNDNATFNGFNVSCTPLQKARILEAETRARQILDIAMPANANARVNRTSAKAGIFRTYFLPNGNTNPDPNRTSPDAWDTATFRVGQKLSNVAQALGAVPFHTCHGPNESVREFSDGTFQTCAQSQASAVTAFVGGTDNPIRWCDVGLAQEIGPRAVAVLHELTHQDRTADATGGRVFDNGDKGRLYDAANWNQWFSNNQR